MSLNNLSLVTKYPENAAHGASLKAGAICNNSQDCLVFYILYVLWLNIPKGTNTGVDGTKGKL